MCGKFMSFPENERGNICNSVMVNEKLEIEREFYFSLDICRKHQQPVITYSPYGGHPLSIIERRYPESIHKVYVDIQKDLKLNDLFAVADNLGIHEKQSTLAFFLKNLWECYKQKDAHRILINPLIYASDHRFYAANCQIKVDENSIFRQPEIAAMCDYSQVGVLERAAFQRAQLRYV